MNEVTAEEVHAVFRRFDQMCASTKDRDEVADLNAILKRAIEGPPLSLAPPICAMAFPVNASGFLPCTLLAGHAGLHHSEHNRGAMNWERKDAPIRYEGDDK